MKRTPSFGGNRMGKHRYHRTGSGGVASIRVFFIALLFFLGISFALSILYHAGLLASPFGRLSWLEPQNLGMMSTDGDSFDSITLDNEDIRLERVLKAASMRDKTVILTTLNAAWANPGSVIDLFMESSVAVKRHIIS